MMKNVFYSEWDKSYCKFTGGIWYNLPYVLMWLLTHVENKT